MVDYFVSFGIKDIIDVLCVSLLLFYLYKLMKRTGSLNMFIGILVFILVWIVVSQVLKMELLGAVMNKLVDVGVLALIVLFADDIRHFFRDIGTSTRTRKVFHWLVRRHNGQGDASKWEPVAKACENMSVKKEGALIVIGGSDELHDVIASGEEVNANINQRLIENIFFKNSPLHDGAMIIVGDRIEAAACILPLSQSEELPKEFGLRHRSAMGISEKTNAVALVVSEETGIISVFHKGAFRRNLAAEEIAGNLAENVR